MTVPSIWRGPDSPAGRACERSYSAKSWPKDSVVSVESLDSGVGFESGVVVVDMNCWCLESMVWSGYHQRVLMSWCTELDGSSCERRWLWL